MKRMLLLLFFPNLCLAQYPLNPHELPFGSYSTLGCNDESFYTAGRRDSMREELGLRMFMSSGFDETTLDNWVTDSIYPYPWRTMANEIDPQIVYAGANYYLCQPESSAFYEIDFETVNGVPQGNYQVYNGSGTMLGDLRMGQDNNYIWLEPQHFEYYPALKLKRQDGIGQDDTLASFEIRRNDSLIFKDYVVGRDVPIDHDTILYMVNDSLEPHLDFYRIRNDDSSGGAQVRFDFSITGICSVYVDHFKVHCQYGSRLIDSSRYDTQIMQSVGRSAYDGKILGWFLKDTQGVMNWRPFNYIDNLIKEAMVDSTWDYPVRGATWVHAWPGNRYHRGYSDFLKIAKPSMLWVYLYPLYINSEYTGFPLDPAQSLQKGLQFLIAAPAADLRQAIGDTISWLFTPEFWYCDPDDPNPEDTLDCRAEPVRRPTRSELRCQMFVGLCYHPEAVIFWKYDSMGPPNGITDRDGNPRPGMYNAVKDDINPYLKAIDSIYLGLEWVRAYTDHATEPVYDPPEGAIVSTITAVSNPCEGAGDAVECNNPDLGWFQVGEFTKPGTSDRYFLLVNRACSQGTDDDTEAPSITATVHFNYDNLNLGDYVYVIDLGRSLRLAGGDTGWVAIPETTYTALMPDGTIPYTTVLRAGEGRLFKIVDVDENYWTGQIATNLIYQGRMKITGDATVPSAKTLQIKGPARFEVYRCDDQHSGQNQGIVELKVIGTLSARGNYYNPIEFYPDTVEMCDTLTRSYPQKGDWYGIYVQSGAACTLSFCSVAYADYGVEIRNTAHAAVDHSILRDNKSIGLYCYQGYLNVTGSDVNDNGSYGIYGYNADVDADYCGFRGNLVSGIKLYGSATGDSAILAFDTVTTAGPTGQNAYGISITSNDKVRVSKCKSWGHAQSGLYLNNSDAWIINSDFSGNYPYGVYADNYSYPKIRRCRIDTLRIGVMTNQSEPNIGRITGVADSGNCTFLSCSDKYIYHANNSPLSYDTMYAQLNYYGQTYDPQKFFWKYPNTPIKYLPVLTSPPSAPRRAGIWEIPLAFSLKQNYPNPFNPTSTISFALDQPGYTRVTIYNLLGQRVTNLVAEYLQTGEHAIIWDGRNEWGEAVSSGLYFYVIESGEHFETKKMTLLR